MKGLKVRKAEIESLAEVYYWVQQDPYTFVSVKVHYNGKEFIGHGFSKRNPKDESNAELGKTIAFGRAIHNVTRQVIRGEVIDLVYGSGKSLWVTTQSQMPSIGTVAR